MGILTALGFGKGIPQEPPSTSGLRDDELGEAVDWVFKETMVENPPDEFRTEYVEKFDKFMAERIFYKLPKRDRPAFFRILEMEEPHTILFLDRNIRNWAKWYWDQAALFRVTYGKEIVTRDMERLASTLSEEDYAQYQTRMRQLLETMGGLSVE